MKFGDTPVAEAEGAILAHSLKGDGIVFKKGRVLSRDDVATLQRIGRASVLAARLEDSDMPEDQAAAAIAQAAAGENLKSSAAFTGRCNLFAAVRGLAIVDTARLDRLNQIDESITMATVPPYLPVEPRQMVATIKIIPFAAPRLAVAACAAVAGDGGPLVRLAPYRARKVGLVQTLLPGVKPSVIESTVATTRARVSALGSDLVQATTCDHAPGSLQSAIAGLQAHGCELILVLGASAIVDRRDVIPAAIVAQGGEVLHFGMPVDPGNLLLLGRIGDRPVVGLPSCARSPKLNGFDWVLQRLLADVPISRADIMHMGAGGLLTEIMTRPLPRALAAPEPAVEIQRAPRIATVVLAAGRSSRMAPANKLLTEVDGRMMVVRAVEAALASHGQPVLVVVGHDGARVRKALEGRPVRFVENPDFAAGLSTSVKAGIAALPEDIDGALFMLGDMPMVRTEHLDRLIAAFNPVERRSICVPTYRAKRGNPVLWAKRFLPAMAAIAGDTGARALLGEHAEEVCEVDMADPGILLDIDTPEALAEIRNAGQKASA